MLQGYKLKIDNPSYFEGQNTSELLGIKDRVRKELDKFFVDGEDIDGGQLMNDWFPVLDECHVFISHSHADEQLAINIAGYLFREFGLVSFIDSMVWGYCDDLLMDINNKYSRIEGQLGSYYLDKTNNAASHVYMMLSSALNKMIEHCECLVFLNTDNSTINNVSKINDETYSPWIMSELLFSSQVKPEEKIERVHEVILTDSLEHRAMDAEINKSLRIRYPVNTNHLHNIHFYHLDVWRILAKNDKGYRALTHLYNTVGDFENKVKNV